MHVFSDYDLWKLRSPDDEIVDEVCPYCAGDGWLYEDGCECEQFVDTCCCAEREPHPCPMGCSDAR